jgi:type III secretion protein J
MNALRLVFPLAAALSLSACSVELQHDLSEADANEIYVLLQRNNIGATKIKEEGGNEPRYIISVSKQEVGAAAQLLKENSLPRPQADGLGIFKKMKGMIPTQTEERAMFIEALAGEVSNALNRIPGVLEARTIVMIPETNDLTQPDKKPLPSASVFIKYVAEGEDKTTPPITESEVREFVANAVSELKKENVKVLMTPARQVATAMLDPENSFTDVMGLRMHKKSATTFQVMVAVNALLFIALAGVAAFLVIRKPSGSSRPPTRKTQSQAQAEG